LVDRARSRLLVVPPHVLDGYARPRRDDLGHVEVLRRALAGFSELRLGRQGVLRLRSSESSRSADSPSGDPLCATARRWASVTDYVVTHHAKRTSAQSVVLDDVVRECQRRRLPTPKVTVREARGVGGLGVVASVELTFSVAVAGPIVLGRMRHLGGGLFQPAESEGR
jgi:CRISPR-associated protein Csb2